MGICKTSVGIYSLHPITYQTPIFESLYERIKKNDLDIDIEVLFGDDLSLREVFYDELNSSVTFDHDLRLEQFPHRFLKNYAKDSKKSCWW